LPCALGLRARECAGRVVRGRAARGRAVDHVARGQGRVLGATPGAEATRRGQGAARRGEREPRRARGLGEGAPPREGPREGFATALGEPGGGAAAVRGGRGRGRCCAPGEPGAGAARARGGGGRGHTQGRRRGGEERERGRGELTLGSKSGDHRLQNLGHHRERERWRIGGCCTGKSNERKGEKGGGGAHGGGAGRRGRVGQSGPAGPGWAGLGRARSWAGTEAHSTRDHRLESKSWNEIEQNTRLSTTPDKEI
jgi:hypothetical protein